MKIKLNTHLPSGSVVLATVIFGLLFNFAAFAQSSIPENWGWVPNNTVNAIIKDPASNTLYLGGSFTAFYKPAPFLAALDISTGAPDLTTLKPNWTVNAVVPDGNGGWFIGGEFTMIGGQARNRLAHIDASGHLTAWNPNVNNAILTMALYNNQLFIGGYFSNVGGLSRIGLAAVDINTGVATSLNPEADGSVKALAIANNTLYIGGDFFSFSSLPGQLRRRLAAIDLGTGLFTSWNPDMNGSVEALTISGNVVYAGGGFTKTAVATSGTIRNHIAAIDATSGVATSWNPNANGDVYSLASSSGTIYVGGQFASIGGQNRIGIAAISSSTGNATSWDPNLNGGQVNAIAISGSTIYVGGNFADNTAQIGGQFRSGLAAIDANTGLATAWDPSVASSGGGVSPDIRCISVAANSVYVGGSFIGFSEVQRRKMAAIDALTGEPTAWNPPDFTSGSIYALALKDNTIYAGGQFSTVGGQSRSNIAAIDIPSSSVTSWNPGILGGFDPSVRALLVSGSNIYIGGQFTSAGGQTRNRLAAINTTTGAATNWNPNVGGTAYYSQLRVNSMVKSGTAIYIGGDFTTVNGQTRNRIAAVDVSTGAPTSWNPGSTIPLNTVTVNGSAIYLGAYSDIKALDLVTGTSLWETSADANVNSILVKGGQLYAGGNFTFVGGQNRSGLASFDLSNGSVTSNWMPLINDNSVHALATAGTDIYVGGDFFTVNNQPLQSLAAFAPCATPAKPGTITQSGGAVKVCPGETRTYSITAANNATGYTWVVPTGATIASGQGTTSITVSFDGAYASVDTIKVRSEGNCDPSDYRTKVVTRGTAPNIPAAITGENYGLCSQSGIAYSTTSVPDITYTWSFSNANGTVSSGQGTSAITADFTPGAATSVLSVTATNGCGTSNPRNKTIYAKPLTPTSITGSAAVCAHATGVAYSTPAIYGATTYTWKAPAGSHVSDGVTISTGTSLTTTSNSVTVNFGAVAGNVQVKANNACASSGFFLKPVTMNCRMVNGAEEILASGEVNVYPNPAINEVRISFSAEKAEDYSIHLYDVIGKEVVTMNGVAAEGSNQIKLNTSVLASGVYHLVLKGTGLDYNTKLVLNK